MDESVKSPGTSEVAQLQEEIDKIRSALGDEIDEVDEESEDEEALNIDTDDDNFESETEDGQFSGQTASSVHQSTRQSNIQTLQCEIVSSLQVTGDEFPPDLYTCLLLNKAYQEILTEALKKVELKLQTIRNRQKELQGDLETTIAKSDPKRRPEGWCIGEYFRDNSGMRPPQNIDSKLKASRKEINPYATKPTSWHMGERMQLYESVVENSKEKVLRPLMNKKELEYEKLLEAAKEDEDEIQARIEAINLQINKKRRLTPHELFSQVSAEEIDWLKISSKEFDGKRDAASCQLMWQNVLHPFINRGKWHEDESMHLIALAKHYDYKNWLCIASELGTNRTAFQCLQHYQQVLCPQEKRDWTAEEDYLLHEVVSICRVGQRIPWNQVAFYLDVRSPAQCHDHYFYMLRPQRKRWTAEEDKKLVAAIQLMGTDAWERISLHVSSRSSTQCRERYQNSLDPSLIFAPWTYEDHRQLYEITDKMEPKVWFEIARHFPGRTDNMALIEWKRMQRKKIYVDWFEAQSVETRNFLLADPPAYPTKIPGEMTTAQNDTWFETECAKWTQKWEDYNKRLEDISNGIVPAPRLPPLRFNDTKIISIGDKRNQLSSMILKKLKVLKSASTTVGGCAGEGLEVSNAMDQISESVQSNNIAHTAGLQTNIDSALRDISPGMTLSDMLKIANHYKKKVSKPKMHIRYLKSGGDRKPTTKAGAVELKSETQVKKRMLARSSVVLKHVKKERKRTLVDCKLVRAIKGLEGKPKKKGRPRRFFLPNQSVKLSTEESDQVNGSLLSTMTKTLKVDMTEAVKQITAHKLAQAGVDEGPSIDPEMQEILNRPNEAKKRDMDALMHLLNRGLLKVQSTASSEKQTSQSSRVAVDKGLRQGVQDSHTLHTSSTCRYTNVSQSVVIVHPPAQSAENTRDTCTSLSSPKPSQVKGYYTYSKKEQPCVIPETKIENPLFPPSVTSMSAFRMLLLDRKQHISSAKSVHKPKYYTRYRPANMLRKSRHEYPLGEVRLPDKRGFGIHGKAPDEESKPDSNNDVKPNIDFLKRETFGEVIDYKDFDMNCIRNTREYALLRERFESLFLWPALMSVIETRENRMSLDTLDRIPVSVLSTDPDEEVIESHVNKPHFWEIKTKDPERIRKRYPCTKGKKFYSPKLQLMMKNRKLQKAADYLQLSLNGADFKTEDEQNTVGSDGVLGDTDVLMNGGQIKKGKRKRGRPSLGPKARSTKRSRSLAEPTRSSYRLATKQKEAEEMQRLAPESDTEEHELVDTGDTDNKNVAVAAAAQQPPGTTVTTSPEDIQQHMVQLHKLALYGKTVMESVLKKCDTRAELENPIEAIDFIDYQQQLELRVEQQVEEEELQRHQQQLHEQQQQVRQEKQNMQQQRHEVKMKKQAESNSKQLNYYASNGVCEDEDMVASPSIIQTLHIEALPHEADVKNLVPTAITDPQTNEVRVIFIPLQPANEGET